MLSGLGRKVTWLHRHVGSHMSCFSSFCFFYFIVVYGYVRPFTWGFLALVGGHTGFGHCGWPYGFIVRVAGKEEVAGVRRWR